MDATASYAAGIDAYRRGDTATAEHHLRQALAARPAYPEALNALGVIATHHGRLRPARLLLRLALAVAPGFASAVMNFGLAHTAEDDALGALPWLTRAVLLAPAHAPAWNNLGLALNAAHRPAAAVGVYRMALELQALPEARIGLAEALTSAGQFGEAAEMITGLINEDRDPTRRRRAIATLLALQVKRDAPHALPPAQPASRPAGRISVVSCSIKPDRFAALRETYARVLSGLDHEVIGIHDARSLCEGYNRGLAQARGDIVIFSHDDIEIAEPAFADRLLAALDRFDLVGVAGSTRCSGELWGHAGPPHLAGRITQYDAEAATWSMHAFGGHWPHTPDIQCLDGVFLACRRSLLDRVRFDEATFDDFHLYDLDFSYAAHLAGFRVGVASDLGLIHWSHGRLDASWRAQADRFLAKYRGRLAEPGQRRPDLGWPAVDFAGPGDAQAYSAGLADHLARYGITD
jgi:Flp pilus assembly protein TadD